MLLEIVHMGFIQQKRIFLGYRVLLRKNYKCGHAKMVMCTINKP